MGAERGAGRTGSVVAGSLLSELWEASVVMAESLCQSPERLCGDGGKLLAEPGEPVSEPGEAPSAGSSPRARGGPRPVPLGGPGGRAFPSAGEASARGQYRSFFALFSF